MISTDYRIEALAVLLDEDCLISRYCPLVIYKEKLIAGLKALGCRTKNDVAELSDDALYTAGLETPAMAGLFRRFLALYDPKPQKFREIPKLVAGPAAQESFRELYHLPGMKFIRASLYYTAGYRTLKDFAETSVKEVLERTAAAISGNKLSCSIPLPKEVRTHIAVAKAFTGIF